VYATKDTGPRKDMSVRRRRVRRLILDNF